MDPEGPVETDGESDLDPDEISEFERAMRSVEPLRGGKKYRPSVRVRRKVVRTVASEPSGLTIERSGEWIEGLARGVPPRDLDKLRRGIIGVDERLDLHGSTEKSARAAVREALAELWRRQKRCLLIIHGRGLRSPGRPVLKESLPTWLAEPPWNGRVRALTSADSARGGTGATLVLLRRRRSEKRGGRS